MTFNDTFIRVDVDNITHVHLRDITLERQRAGIFHRVKKNRRNLAADAHATFSLIGNVWDVVTHVP